jgi:serine palmitoyltransferase
MNVNECGGRRFTGREVRCINLGSYNYLGLGAAPQAVPEVAAAVRRYGLALTSPRAELGTTPLHALLEETTARFLGAEVPTHALRDALTSL